MKNKDFIRIVNAVNPDKNQKEKMFENILNKRTQNPWYSIWKFGVLAMSIICLAIIINGHFHDITHISPYGIRAYKQESSDFYYQNNWYQESGIIPKSDDFIYITTIVEKGETIDIYQGIEPDTLILKKQNSYYLYQHVK